MFKQKGYDVDELPDEEDEPLYTNCRDTLKVTHTKLSHI